MDIERERGITIKSQTVCLPYTAKDGRAIHLNLIDTPGHVDFTYEVSRALASCEGALLLVDASQGVEAQTLANLYLALEHDLEIIPVINKIDLPSADMERVKEPDRGGSRPGPGNAILTSAKEGIGIEDILEASSTRCPPHRRSRRAPAGPDLRLPLRCLPGHHRAFPRVPGTIRPGDRIRSCPTSATYKVEEVGVFQIVRKPQKELSAGQVGY
jgi:GTP-binding protein LepA